MAKSGDRLALNHFRNVSVGLYPRLGVAARRERITADHADARRRAEHPASRAADRAFAAVRRVVGERSALLTAAGIRVDAGTATAPEVARAVIAADADLLELRIDEKSLEEVFFEMTNADTDKLEELS